MIDKLQNEIIDISEKNINMINTYSLANIDKYINTWNFTDFIESIQKNKNYNITLGFIGMDSYEKASILNAFLNYPICPDCTIVKNVYSVLFSYLDDYIFTINGNGYILNNNDTEISIDCSNISNELFSELKKYFIDCCNAKIYFKNINYFIDNDFIYNTNSYINNNDLKLSKEDPRHVMLLLLSLFTVYVDTNDENIINILKKENIEVIEQLMIRKKQIANEFFSIDVSIDLNYLQYKCEGNFQTLKKGLQFLNITEITNLTKSDKLFLIDNVDYLVCIFNSIIENNENSIINYIETLSSINNDISKMYIINNWDNIPIPLQENIVRFYSDLLYRFNLNNNKIYTISSIFGEYRYIYDIEKINNIENKYIGFPFKQTIQYKTSFVKGYPTNEKDCISMLSNNYFYSNIKNITNVFYEEFLYKSKLNSLVLSMNSFNDLIDSELKKLKSDIIVLNNISNITSTDKEFIKSKVLETIREYISSMIIEFEFNDIQIRTDLQLSNLKDFFYRLLEKELSKILGIIVYKVLEFESHHNENNDLFINEIKKQKLLVNFESLDLYIDEIFKEITNKINSCITYMGKQNNNTILNLLDYINTFSCDNEIVESEMKTFGNGIIIHLYDVNKIIKQELIKFNKDIINYIEIEKQKFKFAYINLFRRFFDKLLNELNNLQNNQRSNNSLLEVLKRNKKLLDLISITSLLKDSKGEIKIVNDNVNVSLLENLKSEMKNKIVHFVLYKNKCINNDLFEFINKDTLAEDKIQEIKNKIDLWKTISKKYKLEIQPIISDVVIEAKSKNIEIDSSFTRLSENVLVDIDFDL